MIWLYSLQFVNVGPDIRYDPLEKYKHGRYGHSVIAEFSFTTLFAKIPRILLSIEINANCRFCMISWFGDET